MKKKLIVLMFMCVFLFLFSSCAISAFEFNTSESDFWDILAEKKNSSVSQAWYDNIISDVKEMNNPVVSPTETEHMKLLYKCYIEDFYFYPQILIDYVGTESFESWIMDSETVRFDENNNLIPRNIMNFLEDFNITQSEFEAIYYTSSSYYTSIYDVDLMYTGTTDEINDFFMDFEGWEAEYNKRCFISTCKRRFRKNISNWTSDEAVIKKYKTLPYTAWTFADIIYDANIPRADAEEILSDMEFFTDENFDDIYEAVTAKKNGTLERGSALELQMFGGGKVDVESCKRVVESEEAMFYPSPSAAK